MEEGKARRVYVCCPGDIVTGGPELLHQLVSQLRRNGYDAYISYYPLEKKYETPEQYRHYGAPISDIEDADDALIISPEDFTKIKNHIKHARIAIWWLSVDGYFQTKSESILKDALRRVRSFFYRKTLWALRNDIHLVQSEYARAFLESHNISSLALGDYIDVERAATEWSAENRENIIVYNPKKGVARTARIIASSGDLRFVPIQNMTPMEVKALLLRAKIYMDFGNHPGKDRIPREAALAGCCVITNKRGSALNKIDVPILEKYKLDDRYSGYELSLRIISAEILSNFKRHAADFDEYRAAILKERDQFNGQVQILADKYLQRARGD